jgi:L-rhamnose isomerase
MRTSLNEIKLIDGYLFNSNPPEEALLLDALLIVNPTLSSQITWQKKTHRVIRQYSRKKLKAEIEAVHQQLFNEPKHQTFRQKVLSFFKS